MKRTIEIFIDGQPVVTLVDGEREANREPVAEEPLTTLAEVKRRYVDHVLAHTHGNKQAASRILGIDRKTIDRTIKK